MDREKTQVYWWIHHSSVYCPGHLGSLLCFWWGFFCYVCFFVFQLVGCVVCLLVCQIRIFFLEGEGHGGGGGGGRGVEGDSCWGFTPCQPVQSQLRDNFFFFFFFFFEKGVCLFLVGWGAGMSGEVMGVFVCLFQRYLC